MKKILLILTLLFCLSGCTTDKEVKVLDKKASTVAPTREVITESGRQAVITINDNVKKLQKWNTEAFKIYNEVLEFAAVGNISPTDVFLKTKTLKNDCDKASGLMQKMPIPTGLPKEVQNKLEEGSTNIARGYKKKSEALDYILSYLNTLDTKYVDKYKEAIEEGSILINTGTLEIMEAYYAVTK